MFHVIEHNILNPRGFYWKRTFATHAEAEAAIDRFFARNPFAQSTLRIYFQR